MNSLNKQNSSEDFASNQSGLSQSMPSSSTHAEHGANYTDLIVTYQTIVYNEWH